MTVGEFKRSTPQRRTILEELQKLSSHPTAGELYEIVREHIPGISLGTIYRNLELLARNGTIQKLELRGGQARFDGDPEPHGHLRCVCCGEVTDFHGFALNLDDAEPRDAQEYEVLGYRLEFTGICPACRADANAKGVEVANPHTQ